MGSLSHALQRRNEGAPPVWMMRQAGRYHRHYQNLRARHGFMELCQNPSLAAKVALGPVEAFGFDAAILFSDILFPLQALGQPLTFNPGPQLGFTLTSPQDIARYTYNPQTIRQLDFQAEALRLTRTLLPTKTELIGFVGGPLTLFVFACGGSHRHGTLQGALKGITDGRFEPFMDIMVPLLTENMALQAEAGCDMMAVLDTCAGDIPPAQFTNLYLPRLGTLLGTFATRHPQTPVLYYGKGLSLQQLDELRHLPLAAIGIDHHQSLPRALEKFSDTFALQGNFPPEALTLPPEAFEVELQAFITTMRAVPRAQKRGWICGLGHGITPAAREENVRRFVQAIKQQEW